MSESRDIHLRLGAAAAAVVAHRKEDGVGRRKVFHGFLAADIGDDRRDARGGELLRACGAASDSGDGVTLREPALSDSQAEITASEDEFVGGSDRHSDVFFEALGDRMRGGGKGWRSSAQIRYHARAVGSQHLARLDSCEGRVT